MFRALFQLFRIPNLIILVGTIYLVAHRVVYPPLIERNILSSLGTNDFFLVLFIVICIGAGGYLYNDIVDVEADRANNRETIIGSLVGKKLAVLMYWFITITPLIGVFSLVIELGMPFFFWGYCALVGIFLIYNHFLQNLPFAGNAVVAALCAFGVVLPFLLELKGLLELYEIDEFAYRKCFNIVIAFALFAFGSNLTREIIKDMADVQGDQSVRQKTIPIVAGRQRTKWIVHSLNVILGGTILVALLNLDLLTHILVICLSILIIPLIIFASLTHSAVSQNEFDNLSKLWKMYFLLGLIVLLIIT